MTVTVNAPPAEQVEALGDYLRRVADALAAPEATPEGVLVGARALDVRRDTQFVSFSPPATGGSRLVGCFWAA